MIAGMPQDGTPSAQVVAAEMVAPGRRGWLLGLMVACIFLAYLPILRNGFVWDDDRTLTQNPLITAPHGLSHFWLGKEANDYWPATYSMLWMEWRLWGPHATCYHAASLLLHVGASVLLWKILQRLGVPGPFWAALLFAVHPVNVESVAWIADQKNLLSMLFFLAAIRCFLKTGWEAPTPVPRIWYGCSLLCFALAMLSKGSVAPLPLVLAGLIRSRRKFVWPDAVRLAPFFVVAAGLTLVNIWFQARHFGQVIRTASPLERILGAGTVPWFYLGKALWPIHLVFAYRQWDIRADSVFWWLPLLGAVALTGVLWRLSRAGLLAWAYFCAMLIPVMGLTDVYFMRYSLVADHYQHLALIAVTTLLAAACVQWRAEALAAVAAGILGVLTWRQCGQYRDSETLFRSTLSRNPESSFAHNNLGELLARSGHVQEALGHFQAALRLKPDAAEAESNLSAALLVLGRLPEAIEEGESAFRHLPNNPQIRFNLALAQAAFGSALAQAGRLGEAIPHLERAAWLRPDDAKGQLDLAVALAQAGRPDQAIEHFEQTIRLQPNNAEAHLDLAVALWQVGRRAEAQAEHEQGLNISTNKLR